MEHTISKHQLLTNQLPSTLKSISVFKPNAIDSIEDQYTRECFNENYQQLTHQAKSDLLHLSIRAEEILVKELQQKLTKIYNELKDNSHVTSINNHFTASMIEILQQGFQNINRYFKRIYDHKLSYLAVNIQKNTFF